MDMPLLSMEKTQIVGEKPFENDLLNRRDLADKLTQYIDRLKMGAVIAIDAPWGDGKTWFGKNWSEQLKLDGYSVAYIDAFEQDYMDDPFILLASELLDIIQDKSQAKIKLTKKATNVIKATASISAKVGIGLITKLALGGVDLGDEIEGAISEASKETANKSSKWIEKRFKKYSENKKSISEFKEELKKYALSQEKPIIIFIDELDRCKPNFAVSLIERIKHFFDVPNVVFVLLLNREQLEKAIKGVYGVDTDAFTYLGKFINFSFNLPKVNLINVWIDYPIQQFINETLKKYKFPKNINFHLFSSSLEFWGNMFNLSLRDIEKAIALYAFSGAYNVMYKDFLIYVIVLKIKENDIFRGLITLDIEAHKKMIEKLNNLIEKANAHNRDLDKDILVSYRDWHITHINDDFKNAEGRVYEITKLFINTRPKYVFPFLAQKIDLTIS